MHGASRIGDSKIVSLLIEYGAEVNLLSSAVGAYSPLYTAARYANVPVVSKLIRAGADVNLVVNDVGYTALMGALSSPAEALGMDNTRLYRRQIDTISLLLQAGANINAVSLDGNTALLCAIWHSYVDQVRFLIANGANVNQGTAFGGPLMSAIQKDDFNKVRLLVLAGAETRNIPGSFFLEYIQPVMSSLDEVVSDHSSLISMAYVQLKNGEQNEKMFQNAAFRDLFNEWDDLKFGMVSRIVPSLVTLETEDTFVTYILAPFLVNAGMDRLNELEIVLSFLTAPCTSRIKVYHGTDKPELVRFIKATFRYAILMGSFEDDLDALDSFVGDMFAVFSNLNAEMGALDQAIRGVIPDVHIGNVLRFRHGEFGSYSKSAENLKRRLRTM